MLAVLERGTQGTERLHVHLAVNRFIDRRDVQWYWHHGNVDVGDFGRLTGEQAPRELAGYLSKYVAKTFDEPDQPGDIGRVDREHRYLVAQGHQPEPVRRQVDSGRQADRWLRRYVGAHDVELRFGTRPEDDVWGVWRGYPDSCLWRRPRP